MADRRFPMTPNTINVRVPRSKPVLPSLAPVSNCDRVSDGHSSVSILGKSVDQVGPSHGNMLPHKSKSGLLSRYCKHPSLLPNFESSLSSSCLVLVYFVVVPGHTMDAH